MSGDDRLANAQPQTGAACALFARPRLVGAVESLEDVGQGGRGDSRAVVLDSQPCGLRGFVAHELLKGRVALIGDAAHTVPPTGAKGMNLAVADVLVLEKALRALLLDNDQRPLEAFPETALHRIWKAQHFSWWMTSMLHVAPDATDFDRRRQLGELRSVVESEAGRRYLAEAYTGWPLEGLG